MLIIIQHNDIHGTTEICIIRNFIADCFKTISYTLCTLLPPFDNIRLSWHLMSFQCK